MKKIDCPCCGHDKHLILRKFSIAELSSLWVKHFGFNPFIEWSAKESITEYRCIFCYLVFHSPEIYGDDEFYAHLSEYDWYYESEKWEFDVTLDLISQFRPTSLLEVGCGSGEFLQKVVFGVERVMGIDINPVAITRAQSKGLVASDQSLSQLKESFDMVVLFEVLEHLQSPREMIKEIIEHLNPGGVLVIAVPNPAGYLKDQGLVLLDLPPHHSTKWDRKTFNFITEKFGMQEVTYVTEPMRFIHFQAHIAAIIAIGGRRRIVSFLQKLAFKVLAPFLFDIGRDRILRTDSSGCNEETILIITFWARIKIRYRHEQFHPSLIALFINPFYFARTGLLDAMISMAPFLSGNLLDVGCGSQPYRRYFEKQDYVGLDLDTEPNRKSGVADFFYDGSRFPFEDNSFDSVLCNQVLEHVFNPNEFLAEIRRVLKPGGRLLLTVPFIWDEHEQPYDCARYTSFGLHHLFERQGLRWLEHRKLGNDASILFQLANAYLFKICLRLPRWWFLILSVTVMATLNLLGVVAKLILPRNEDMYLDHVILAENTK